MSTSPDDHPPAPDGVDRQLSPAALYLTLLSDHDQGAAAGRPLLTEAGVERLQQLLDTERDGRPAGLLGPTADRPRWDPDRRRLFLGTRVLREFHRSAPAQTALLAAFEAHHWSGEPVVGPLPLDPGETPDDYRRRLRETVKNLNRELPLGTLHFREDRGRVWWERVSDLRDG